MRSGHYRPTQQHFNQFLTNMKEDGVHIDSGKVSSGI
jgi:hypothetical protein